MLTHKMSNRVRSSNLLLWVSALYYSTGRQEFGGVSDRASAHALHLPTIICPSISKVSNQKFRSSEWWWGWVDNEHNSQSRDSKISITYMNGSLIYRVREQSISQGYQKCKREHSKVMYTWMGNIGMWRWEETRNETYTNREHRVGTW